MQKIKLSIALLFIATFPVNLYAQYDDMSMENLRNEIKKSITQMKNEHQNLVDSIVQEYDQYIEQVREEYNQYTKSIEKVWGAGNAVMSDKHSWVEYGGDKKSRTAVNFEKGEAKVEVVLTNQEFENKTLVNQKLKQSVVQLLNSQGKTVDYNSKYIPQEKLSDNSVMEGIIDTDKYSKDDSSEAIAEAIIKKEKVQVEKGQNENSYIVTITPAMVGDYIYKLAKRYESIVDATSKRFAIDKSLIFAIIEIESHFNPAAASHIPAYGLMQIVPKYAGRDTYKMLYGQDKLLDCNYLYQPDKNIEIGVGYLNILATRYFQNVDNQQNKELCMIAAYNTGAGNVSRAIAGHTNIFKAVPEINQMSYNQLYTHLRSKLPWDETRKYIQKVINARGKYNN